MSRIWDVRQENVHEKQVEKILDACLEDIRCRHVSVAECLAKHDEQAVELAPLLRVAVDLDRLADVHPSLDFRRATRRRVANLPASDPSSEFSLVRFASLIWVRWRRLWISLALAALMLLTSSAAIAPLP